MSLTKYRQKRAFDKTPEPTGGQNKGRQLIFVVQKHDATRLHYDFRLEVDGVLKSWAVPKGPSLNPADKRLAMMVEDHPFDYRDFEGIIPKGQYGGGTVIVWDQGTYEPIEAVGSKKEAEKLLLKQLKAGSVKIKLNGSKLKGEFALVHTHGRGENSWLLIKHRDKFASEKDITLKDKSVVSGKTIAKMEKTPDRIYGSGTVEDGEDTARAAGKTVKDEDGTARDGRKAQKGAGMAVKDEGESARGGGKSARNIGGTARGDGRTGGKTVKDEDGTARDGRKAQKGAGKIMKGNGKIAKGSGKIVKGNAKRAKAQAEKKIKQVISLDAIEKPVKKKARAGAEGGEDGKAGAGATASEGVKAPFPKTISPMLATLVDSPVEGPEWLYEIKWDGYRAIAMCKNDQVELISRNNKSFNDKFYAVHDALKLLGFNAVLDGEIVVIKKDGVSNFGALQNWRSEADGDLVYYVFDLLWLNGYDLMGLPLSRRREMLHDLLPTEGIIRESESFKTSATEFLAAAAEMEMEGIIAKKADSIYSQGDRGHDWLKIKVHKRHEVVIGGFTKNEGSPKAFSSLLVGVYEDNKLQYTGKIGTGFNDKQQKEMMAAFKPLLTDKPPFSVEPDVNEPSRFRRNPPHAEAYWLKPKLVCEVSYAEMTTDGVMRHPSFEGMREDKKATDVHAEVPEHTQETGSVKKTDKKSAIRVRPGKGERKSLLNPKEETQVKVVNGHELKFSNLSKLFWPKEGYTKRDMLNYYYQIAEYILPYLKDRPQSLNRYPNGIDGKSFYFKDVTATAPDWVKQFPYRTSEGEDKNFLVVEDEASILWMANMGAIEMNPWNSTIINPDNPDWCIIDLDPSEKNSFEQVIQTAQVTKEVLDDLGIQGYPKTSGSTGIHIYIPLAAKYTYDECQLFGKLIATRVHEALPAFTSIERMTQKRKGKLYVDYLQNRAKATLAAPYALRPKPGATVSMPLPWEEVKKGLKMSMFTIKNALDRVKKEGDIFKPVLGKGVDIAKALKALETEKKKGR